MAKGLVIHRSDEGQRGDPFDYNRSVSFDGVDFGWVYRDGWPDNVKWSFMSLDVCNDENLCEIRCDKEYDSLWQIRAELESLIKKQKKMRKIQAKQAAKQAELERRIWGPAGAR